MLKIKTFTSLFARWLDRKVNRFISDPSIEIVEVVEKRNFFEYVVTVTYKSS